MFPVVQVVSICEGMLSLFFCGSDVSGFSHQKQSPMRNKARGGPNFFTAVSSARIQGNISNGKNIVVINDIRTSVMFPAIKFILTRQLLLLVIHHDN